MAAFRAADGPTNLAVASLWKLHTGGAFLARELSFCDQAQLPQCVADADYQLLESVSCLLACCFFSLLMPFQHRDVSEMSGMPRLLGLV